VEQLSLSRWNIKRDDHHYWVTAAVAAEMLGLGKRYTLQLANAGDLPSARHPNGQVVFRKDQIRLIANAREARRLRS
jgi:hypothetical protein